MEEKQKLIVLIMAIGVLLVGFLYLFAVTFFEIPETGKDHAKVILGFMLGDVIGLVLGYFWGSSSGSTAKSGTIDRMIKPPTG